MLHVSWPEIEKVDSSRFATVAPTKHDSELAFKQGLFVGLRERLNPDVSPEGMWETLLEGVTSLLAGVGEDVDVADVLKWVEQVLDIILPKIDFPGPFDSMIRRVIKSAAMKLVEETARKLLDK